MKIIHRTLIALLALSAGPACRSLTVRGAEPGHIELIQGQAAEKIYFERFSLESVELSGDHGGTGNPDKWFAHVVVGAQKAADKDLPGTKVMLVGHRSPQLPIVEDKYDTRIEPVDQAPADALVVRGRFVYSEEISGTSRAVLGMMAGKSWTRARVEVLRGGENVYTCHVDGKYLGNGYSWGYESLGANEEVGRAIVQVIAALKAGKTVKSEPLVAP